MLVAGNDLNINNSGCSWLGEGGSKWGGHDASRDTQNMKIENIKSK